MSGETSSNMKFISYLYRIYMVFIDLLALFIGRSTHW